jgi:DNA-binding NarL/FixJ family response regulator
MALNNLGKLEVRRGERDLARAHLLEALKLAQRMGNRRRMAYTLSAVGELLVLEGDVDRAARLQAVASAAIAELGAIRPLRTEPVTSSQAAVRTAIAKPMTFDHEVEHTIAHLGALLQSGREDEAQRAATSTPGPFARPRGAGPRVGGLTRREHEVAVLVTSGYTNRQIAEQLVITEGTAENYVQRILGKLGFNNRAQIAVWAIQHGLGPRPLA